MLANAMDVFREPSDTSAAKRLCLSLRKKPRSLKQTTLFDRPTESSSPPSNELPPSPPFAGLQNTGNTCYFNALIQLLRYVPGFTHALTEDVDEMVDEGNTAQTANGCFARELCLLFREMEDAERRQRDCPVNGPLVVQPQRLLNMLRRFSPSFQPYQQHDVQELFHTVLGHLDSASESANGADVETKRTSATEDQRHDHGDDIVSSKPIVEHCEQAKQLFSGRLEAVTRCVECETTSLHQEDFMDVSLSVNNDKQGASDLSSPKLLRPEQEEHVARHSLAWCFDHFTKPRLFLAGEDKYACSVCRRACEANTTHRFMQLPPVLVVHLKRFTTRVSTWPGPLIQKLHGNIATPISLTFRPWCDESCTNRDRLYQLCGIIMHCGSRSNTGHYTAYVRAPPDSKVPVFQKSATQPEADKCQKGESAVQSSSLEENISDKHEEFCANGKESTMFEVVGEEHVEWLFLDDGDVRSMSEAQVILALSPLASSPSSPYMLVYRMLPANEL